MWAGVARHLCMRWMGLGWHGDGDGSTLWAGMWTTVLGLCMCVCASMGVHTFGLIQRNSFLTNVLVCVHALSILVDISF